MVEREDAIKALESRIENYIKACGVLGIGVNQYQTDWNYVNMLDQLAILNNHTNEEYRDKVMISIKRSTYDRLVKDSEELKKKKK